MVNLLYAVAAITCALVVLILPARTRVNMSKDNPLDRAFLLLINWTVIFCIADGVWGVAASSLIINDAFLTVMSFIFHLSAAITPIVWLQFILTYLGNVNNKKLYFAVTIGLFAAELVLLILNFRNHKIFYIDGTGAYNSGSLRRFLFYAQYITYITTAAITLFRITWNRQDSSKQRAVLAFVAAPILLGIFQLMYPDAPAYSIGYTLGCCLIYSFVMTEMLEARVTEAARLENANRAKTAFLNSMSHDIRTPLNAITGFNNMAIRALGKDEDRVRDCLQKIGRSSDSLLTIINDILEISRIEAGSLTVNEDKGDVMYSFANIEPMLTQMASAAEIELKFSFGKVEDRYVICDYAHCARVFTNLIGNSIKYTGKGGHISVLCSQTGRSDDGSCAIYTYTVSDDGIGMSEEFQQHMFEPFTRENTSTVTRIQGTGLGLPLCKNLVDGMGGTISCVSRKGEGTTFTVTFPFKIQKGQEWTDPDISSSAFDRFLEGKRILLVEDNELNREIASTLLSEMGAEITEVEDGTDAVSMMISPDAGKFDIILMDIQMPVLNGYDATRQIRALGTRASRIPIVAMTANAFQEDRKLALEAGMNDHITKPIDIPQLRRTLSRVLRLGR